MDRARTNGGPIAADDRLANGYGIRPNAQPGSLLYQNDADTGDMQIDVLMAPEKTEGTGFSIPGSLRRQRQHLAAATAISTPTSSSNTIRGPKNGYALRFWRTNKAPTHCLSPSHTRLKTALGSPLSEAHKAMSAVFKPTTHLTIERPSATNSSPPRRMTWTRKRFRSPTPSCPTATAGPASTGLAAARTPTVASRFPIRARGR